MNITQDKLKSLLNYDKNSGEFTWINSRYKSKNGTVAGCINKFGYIQITVDGKTYKAHRLAWLYVTGKWPDEYIDHINQIRNDNRFINIRECNQSQNQMNTGLSSKNTSGFKGVNWHKRTNTWMARAYLNGQQIILGHFLDKKEASNVYLEFVRE